MSKYKVIFDTGTQTGVIQGKPQSENTVVIQYIRVVQFSHFLGSIPEEESDVWTDLMGSESVSGGGGAVSNSP